MAEAKLGELLKQQSFDKGGRPSKTPNNDVRGFMLKEMGLSWIDSSRAQKIAEYQDLIPEVVAKAQEKKRESQRGDGRAWGRPKSLAR